ncbi:MAG: Gfo/Idh/MocA family protein [Mycobacteriales bacterium]
MRLAIAGCGIIGDFHAGVADSLTDLEVVALVDPEESQRQKLADKWQLRVPQWDTLAPALAAGNIDVVAVCTPSGYHADVAVEALESGAHVVIEKPIDVDLSSAERVRVAADKAGRLVTVISQHRFDRGSAALFAAIKDGKLGTLTSGTATVPWWRSQTYYDSGEWRGTWNLDGGGAAMNQGVHTVDLLTWFLGEPVEVFAWSACLAHERIEVEDVIVATVKFASGALATIHATTAANPGAGVRVSVHGDGGTATIENDRLTWFVSAVDAEPGERPVNTADAEEDARSDGAVAGAAVAGWAASDPTAVGSSHAAQYRNFLDAIADGSQPLVTVEEGTTALRVIRGMYASASSGAPVKLADVSN